jgi:hypothetical protein
LQYRRTDGGLAVSWGLALLLAIGAVLNLARVISPRLIVVLVLAGVVAWVALRGPYRLARAARRLTRWDALLCAVLLAGYLNWLCYSRRPEPGKPLGSHVLFISDDSAYLLLPAGMLQAGSMGIDPFRACHPISTLGGEAFVQSLVLAVLPVEYVHLADPGLAFLAMAVMVMTTRRLTGPARLALGALFAAWPTASINASAVALPVVLLTALTRLMGRPTGDRFVLAGLRLALPLSALMSLKSTMIPGGVLLVFCWGIGLALWTRRIGPVVVGSLAGLFTAVMLLPWMLSSYQSAGTLLYPYLGEGYLRHTLIALPNKSSLVSRSPGAALKAMLVVLFKPQMIALVIGVVLAAVCAAIRGAPRARLMTLAAVCGSGLATIALMIATFGPDEIWRYAYPFTALTTLTTYATILRLAHGGAPWRLARAAAYLVIGGIVLFYGTKAVLSSRDLPDSLAGALAGRRRFPEEKVRSYRMLQASIPPGIRFFSLLNWPMLFDLSRNDPYSPDNIGLVSPPPGIPLRGRSDELVDYLKSQGIRYIACPSVDAMKASVARLKAESLEVEQPNQWIAATQEVERCATERFFEIAARYPAVHADREGRMIDLEGPIQSPSIGPTGPAGRGLDLGAVR